MDAQNITELSIAFFNFLDEVMNYKNYAFIILLSIAHLNKK